MNCLYCKLDGIERATVSGDMCMKHYKRFIRNGDATKVYKSRGHRITPAQFMLVVLKAVVLMEVSK